MNTRFTSSPTGLASHTHVNTHVHTRAACGPKLGRRLPGYRWPGNVVRWSQRKTWRRENRHGGSNGMAASGPGQQEEIKRLGAAYPRRQEVFCVSEARFRLHVSTDAARTALPPPLGFSEPLLSRSLCFGPLHTSLFLSCISNIVVSPVWAAHASLSISF